MEKSVAVLGLGKFGRSLAENLYLMGADVLAVDSNESLIAEFADKCTAAVCANLANEEEVAGLGLQNMDIVVCAMGGNLAASIMSVAVAKEQGVPLVVAKVSTPRMASLLTKVGADKILDPEGQGGQRSAKILMSSMFRDFFEIDSNMYMIEMNVKSEWIGKSLLDLNLRKSLHLNVIAVKEGNGLWHFVDPKTKFTAKSIVLIVAEKQHLDRIQ